MGRKYEAGDTVEMKTQVKPREDGTQYTVYYVHWGGNLRCEGSETITLTEDEANRLNHGHWFTR